MSSVKNCCDLNISDLEKLEKLQAASRYKVEPVIFYEKLNFRRVPFHVAGLGHIQAPLKAHCAEGK